MRRTSRRRRRSIGLAVGAYGLTQAGFQVPLGALSDKIGRMPVIWGGLAIFAAGSILAATSDSIYGVIAGRFARCGSNIRDPDRPDHRCNA